MEKYLEISDMPPRIFAIGDIHGCPAELLLLLEHLRGAKALQQEDLVIFIGDYIDRGPESARVVEMLLAFQKDFPASVFLRGNHEDMMLQYLGFEGTEGYSWLHNGGTTTLKSYGISAALAAQEILDEFPREHLSFFLNLQRYVITAEHVFVHAGLDPLRDLRSQLDSDIYWIRDPFLANRHNFEKKVVFGHTPYRDVFFNLPWKVGLDTGLVYGNLLSCVEFPAGEVMQVKLGGTAVLTESLEIKLSKQQGL